MRNFPWSYDCPTHPRFYRGLRSFPVFAKKWTPRRFTEDFATHYFLAAKNEGLFGSKGANFACPYGSPYRSDRKKTQQWGQANHNTPHATVGGTSRRNFVGQLSRFRQNVDTMSLTETSSDASANTHRTTVAPRPHFFMQIGANSVGPKQQNEAMNKLFYVNTAVVCGSEPHFDQFCGDLGSR